MYLHSKWPILAIFDLSLKFFSHRSVRRSHREWRRESRLEIPIFKTLLHPQFLTNFGQIWLKWAFGQCLRLAKSMDWSEIIFIFEGTLTPNIFSFYLDKLGLGPAYANEPKLALCVRMFWALSCCQVDHVRPRFELLQNSEFYDARLDPYAKYFLVSNFSLLSSTFFSVVNCR